MSQDQPRFEFADFPPPGTAWTPGRQIIVTPAAPPQPEPLTEAQTFAELFPETSARIAALEDLAGQVRQLLEDVARNPAAAQVLAMLGVSLD